MKRTAAIILLIGICFTNIVAAEEIPLWVAKEEYARRYMGVHIDNYNAILLEYAENKITKEELQKAMRLRIEIVRERFVEADNLNDNLYKTRVALLKYWEFEKKKIDEFIEEVKAFKRDEKKLKEEAKEYAIEGIIRDYGYLQQNQRNMDILLEKTRELSNKNNGDNQ
jgi:hypothetical protein